MTFSKRTVPALLQGLFWASILTTTLILGACASDDNSDAPAKSNDTLTFNGVATVTPVSGSATQLVVTWEAATDNVNASDQIRYLVYAAPQLDPQYLGVPRESLLNITEIPLKDLLPNTEYTVMVVAVDLDGNSNPGTVNTQLTARTGDTVSFALDIKPTLQTKCGPGCHDAQTAEASMDLLTDTAVYGSLFNADMDLCRPGKRVVAGDVGNSLILTVLDWSTSDTCSAALSKMPKDGPKPTGNFLVSLKSWIMAGALDN